MSSTKTVKSPGKNNLKLATVAQKSLVDNHWPTKSGMCQMTARLSYEEVVGNLFEFAHLGTAEKARRAFSHTKYAVDPKNGSVIGDILYKKGTPGQPEGHVGIRIPGNLVAENSSVHHNGINGAKGIRTLEEFGHVDLIVRVDLAE